eukprot:tig00000042_g15426.t1
MTDFRDFTAEEHDNFYRTHDPAKKDDKATWDWRRPYPVATVNRIHRGSSIGIAAARRSFDGMGRGWIPAEGKLDLKKEGRTEWPAAEIAAAGPANIRVLDLDGNKLTSIPGAELAKLTNLQRLYVSSNQLAALPTEIGRLAALEELYVWNNQLAALPPEIGRLAALEELYVWNNQLTALPPEIGRLAALQWLNVGGNQLTALPSEIGRLAALEKLYVHNNPVVDSWPEPVRRAVNDQKGPYSSHDAAIASAKAQCAAVVPYLRSLPAPAAAPAPAAPRPAAPALGPCTAPEQPAPAGHLALALKLQLEQARPGLRVFLDVDDSHLELHQIKEIIDASAIVVLIISQDVLARQYVLGEVRHAARAGKDILLLHDDKSCRFPAPAEIPDELRDVFAVKAIPYYAEARFRRVSVDMLLEACDEAARR